MIEEPPLMRAKVSDAANTILDYVNAIMLSTETTMIKYPVKAVMVIK